MTPQQLAHLTQHERETIAHAESLGWTQCHKNEAYGTLVGVPPVKPSQFIQLPESPIKEQPSQ